MQDYIALPVYRPLIKLKKSLASQSRLRFIYEGETGIRETVEVIPHTLFKDEKYNYLSATRSLRGYPEAFRLDRLSRPEVLEGSTS